jgi:hypothetical protein
MLESSIFFTQNQFCLNSRGKTPHRSFDTNDIPLPKLLFCCRDTYDQTKHVVDLKKLTKRINLFNLLIPTGWK